jgi:hypothetical protein
LINLLSVAFRHAPEPVLEYSFGVLIYSFTPFFLCLSARPLVRCRLVEQDRVAMSQQVFE